MDDVIHWKQGDSGTKTLTLLDGAGNVVNLTGSTIKLIVARPSDVLEIDATGDAEGVATYSQTGHTSEEGLFRAEVEVTFAGGSVQTFPEDGYLYVKCSKELNPE